MTKKLLPGKLEFNRKELQEILRRTGETSSLQEVIETGREVGLNADTLEYHAKAIANERKLPFSARVTSALQPYIRKITNHPWISTGIGAGMVTGALTIGSAMSPAATEVITVVREEGFNYLMLDPNPLLSKQTYEIHGTTSEGNPVLIQIDSDCKFFQGSGCLIWNHKSIQDLYRVIEPGMEIKVPKDDALVRELLANDIRMPFIKKED